MSLFLVFVPQCPHLSIPGASTRRQSNTLVVVYTPVTTYTVILMEYVKSTMKLTSIKGFDDIFTLIYYMDNATIPTPIAGVTFDSQHQEMPTNLKVTMVFPAELRNPSANASLLNWVTDLLFPLFESTGPRNLYMPDGGSPPGYYREHFTTLQHCISTAYILHKAKNLTEEDLPAVFVQRFTDPKMRIDKLHQMLKLMLPLIFFLTFLYPCFTNVKVTAIV